MKARGVAVIVLLLLFLMRKSEGITVYKAYFPIVYNRYSPKRGVGATYPDCEQLRSLGVSWYHNWSLRPGVCEGISSVPQVWCLGEIGKPVGGNSNILIAFNEPDQPSQCCLSPEQAAEVWPQVEAMAEGRLLTSPNATWMPWLEMWYQAYTDMYGRPPKVDLVAVDFYASISRSLEILDEARVLMGLWEAQGILIPEFGYPYGTEQEAVEYMQQMVPILEKDSRVIGYAWYQLSQPDDPLWQPKGWVNTSLFDYATGDITLLGTNY